MKKKNSLVKKELKLDMAVTTTDIVALNVARIEKELEIQKNKLQLQLNENDRLFKEKEDSFNVVEHFKKHIAKAQFHKSPWTEWYSGNGPLQMIVSLDVSDDETYKQWKSELDDLRSQRRIIDTELEKVQCKLRDIPRMEREARAKFAEWKLEQGGLGDLTKLLAK